LEHFSQRYDDASEMLALFKVPMGLDDPVECKSPLEAGIIRYSRWS
jgi:hypothetical protein